MKRISLFTGATCLAISARIVSACPWHNEMSADDVAAINLANSRQTTFNAFAPAAAAPIASLNAVAAWKINWSGATAHSPNATLNSHISSTQSDVQGVWFDSNYIYVKATDVPSHDVGRADGNNPAYAANKNLSLRIPRNPTVATTNTALGNGGVGVMVNGALVFDPGDAQSYNNGNVWHRIAQVFESATFDAGPGHSAPGVGLTPSNDTAGTYHYHIGPSALTGQIDAGNTGQRHSPIVGFAYDGYPIYGPYGYSDPANPNSAIKRLATCYTLRNDLATGAARTSLTEGGPTLTSGSYGPNVSAQYPAGSFKEDYKYAAGTGDLNNFNMRYMVTPEYPQGTWAYVMTVNASGTPTFPYLIGPQYYGVVDTANLGPTGANVTVPGTATRLLAGDSNFDGLVNFDDLLIVAANFGKQGITLWSEGDFDSNTDIGSSDLALLQGNYSPSANFAADWSLAQSSVPDPSSSALLGLAAASGMLRRRRHKGKI